MTKVLVRTVGILFTVLIVVELAGLFAGKPNLPFDPDFIEARELCYPDQVDRDPELFWRYRPNQTIRGGFVPQGRYTINARGFRTPDFTDEQPAGVSRVVCMGGSNTFGWGVADADAYPRQLELKLRELDPEKRDWEVVNLGVTNYSSRQGVLLARQLLSTMSADAVFFDFMWGDHQRSANNRPDSDFEIPPAWQVELRNALSRSTSFRWLQTIWRLLASDGPQPSSGATAWRVPLNEFSSNIESLCRVAKEIGAQPVVISSPISLPPPHLSDFEGLFHYHHRYRRAVRFASSLARAEWVELDNAFDTRPEFYQGISAGDYEHYTADGHAFAGEFLARYLLGLDTVSVDTTP